jgi:hypothetical protein
MARPSPVLVSWPTALIVAAVITGGGIFTAFLPQWELDQIASEFNDFLFDLLRFSGGQYFATIISVKGLSHLTAPKNND